MSFNNTQQTKYDQPVVSQTPMHVAYTILTNLSCNLRCTYCYECKQNKVNDITTVKEFIEGSFWRDFHDPESPKDRAVVIDLIGGECLLYPDMLNEICEYAEDCRNYYGVIKPITYSICSNGTLIAENEKIQQFLRKWCRNLYLSISIDGTKENHDKCRIDLEGKGSYDRAVAGIRWVQKNVPCILRGTKATFTHETIHTWADGVINLIELGFRDIGANGIFEELWPIEDRDIIFPQIKRVLDYLLEHDLEDKVAIAHINIIEHVKDVDKGINSFMVKAKKMQNHCGTCKYMRALGFNGEIFGCHRFTTSTTPRPIGKIADNGIIMIANAAKPFIEEVCNQYLEWPDECKECDISGMCPSCSALPYELGISAKEWFAKKPQCGWAHAISDARRYMRDKVREKKGLPPIDD